MVENLLYIPLEAFSLTDPATGTVTQYLQTLVSTNNKVLRLTLDNSGLFESYVELEDKAAFNIKVNKEDYQHVSLYRDSAGKIVTEALPYRASPYPLKATVADVYQHPEGKSWAIVEFNSQIETYFRNSQTNMLWVRQEVDSSKTLSARRREKELKGYQYDRTAAFNPVTRKFDN